LGAFPKQFDSSEHHAEKFVYCEKRTSQVGKCPPRGVLNRGFTWKKKSKIDMGKQERVLAGGFTWEGTEKNTRSEKHES